MPRVSQNHDGSPKRRLQPIFILDEPLGFVTKILPGALVNCVHESGQE